MKRLRPTIPIDDWRLAVDLAKTKKIQELNAQYEKTTVHCDCQICTEWRTVFRKVLPAELMQQIQRLGVNIEAPLEIYGSGYDREEREIRVIYQVAGKILSGPVFSRYEPKYESDTGTFEVLRDNPYFSLRVLPQVGSFISVHTSEDVSHKDSICIDMRLSYPASYLSDNA